MQCCNCGLELGESPHRLILQILNLFVALFIDRQECSRTNKISVAATRFPGSINDNANRAIKEVDLLLGAVPVACHAVLASLDSANWSSKFVS